MKSMTRITALLTALTLLLAAVGALTGGIYAVATDEALYGSLSRETVRRALNTEQEQSVTDYIGMDAARQGEVARQIALYMAMADADDTLEVPELNAREKAHMQDVRRLIAFCEHARTLCVSLAAALAVVIAWTGARGAKRLRAMGCGLLLGLGVMAAAAVALMAAMNTAGFEAMFLGMHRLLFTNDLWLLDPATDILIRMMPQPLFETALGMVISRTAGAFAVTFALLAAVCFVVGGIIRRNLTEREQA